jgi:molecular chaperone DnaK
MTAFLGIDFGTTNSCVAVYHRDRPLIVPSLEGRPATPSCVSFDDLGQPIVGSAARKRLPLAPERTIVGVKRLLGRRFDELGEHEREALPYRLRAGARGEIRIVLDEGSVDEGRSEWSITPEEAATHIFARLRADAEAWLGRRTVACVLTVPAYFNNLQRQALRLAASSAGLEVQRLLNEPTAAALAYGLRADDDLSRRILVCDLGGGTFDVSLLAIEDRSFRVLATSGDPFLGGRDLDQLLADALRGEFLANLDEGSWRPRRRPRSISLTPSRVGSRSPSS